MRSVRMVLGLALILAPAGFGQGAPKKLTRAEALSAATSKVEPAFPPIATQLKIEGKVELEALVAEGGTVEEVSILSGNAVLTKAGADALKKWKFTPFVADGKPVKALAPVTFTFRIGEQR
jgi:protein TonB